MHQRLNWTYIRSPSWGYVLAPKRGGEKFAVGNTKNFGIRRFKKEGRKDCYRKNGLFAFCKNKLLKLRHVIIKKEGTERKREGGWLKKGRGWYKTNLIFQFHNFERKGKSYMSREFSVKKLLL